MTLTPTLCRAGPYADSYVGMQMLEVPAPFSKGLGILWRAVESFRSSAAHGGVGGSSCSRSRKSREESVCLIAAPRQAPLLNGCPVIAIIACSERKKKWRDLQNV